jgi:uncharacterized protein (DUF1800 family)
VRKPSYPRRTFVHHGSIPVIIALVGALTACGGDDASPSASTSGDATTTDARTGALSAGTEAGNDAPTSQFDAVRLANQASFGPNEELVSEIRSKGPAKWVKEQMALSHSNYTSGGSNEVHKNLTGVSFCNTGSQLNNPECWRENLSTEPLVRDFYRNATTQPDQLRQRAALALQHIVVVSGLSLDGTYGFRNYFNGLLDNALGNYRDVLRMVILSPVMGDFQNHVNNDRISPNENIGRELLQLFSIGTCQLNPNGSMVGEKCRPTYNNEVVRNYAFALTGWTYPPGGSADWKCQPEGSNCKFYGGDMVERPMFRDTAQPRKLLSGVVVPANASAPQALEKVLDSLMQHPNMAPFIAERFIQHFVSSNPHRGYVTRVAQAFDSGTFTHRAGGTNYTFGTGKKGDLAATVAATLLDEQARSEGWVKPDSGFLRQPALQFTGAIRAFNGITDGATLGTWWGEQLREHMFRAPTVFSFYPSNYPVAGTNIVGPEFGIHNANGALERLNFLTYLLDWGGTEPDSTIPRATGTKVNFAAFKSSAGDPAALVDRISQLVLGRNLEPATRQSVIDSVSFWTAQNKPDDWRDLRVTEAAFLVLATPDYQIQR